MTFHMIARFGIPFPVPDHCQHLQSRYSRSNWTA